MRTLSQKSVLLFGVVLAMCAFVMPSMASAASWTSPGTHLLSSPNLQFKGLIGAVDQTLGAICTNTQFDSDVISGAQMNITGARFVNCIGTGIAAGCTATPSGAKFNWTATPVATDNIVVEGVHVTVIYEQSPQGGCVAPALGLNLTITGTLGGGSWNSSSRELTLLNETGLVGTSGLGTIAPLVTGTIRDTAGTLNVIM